MYVYVTDRSVEVLLNEEQVQKLAKGEVVVGSPSTGFNPLGERIVVVRQAGVEEIRARMKNVNTH